MTRTQPEGHEFRPIVANIIRALVRKFDKHPWDINNGQCDEFADQLVEALGSEAEVIDLGLDWGHFCVKYRGFYFDSEEPYGVKHWRQLPLCVRNRRL